MKVRVILETPFHAETEEVRKRNIQYAKDAMRDSLDRGEAPLMFHMLYPTQTGGVLDDLDPTERQKGIEASSNWYKVAQLVVVYNDYGISKGMQKGIEVGQLKGVPVKFRSLKEEYIIE